MTPEYFYLYLKKDDFAAKKLLSILCGNLPLSNARRFNDLFDSNFLYDLPDTVTLKDGERDAVDKGYFTEQTFSKIRQRAAEEKIREKYNVACFGERHDSLLMWAHYADSHKGFCLQLKYFPEKLSEECTFEKVHYSTRYPKIDGAKTDDISTVKNLFFTKSVDWLYEKEWRLVAPASMKGGKDFDGQIESPFAIERIYLGVKCDAQEFDILIEGYQGQFDSFITPDKIEDLRQNIDDFACDPERRADKGKTILEYLKTLEISKFDSVENADKKRTVTWAILHGILTQRRVSDMPEVVQLKKSENDFCLVV